MTVHTAVILPVTLFVFGRILYRNEWREEKLFIFLLIFNYLLSFWYALWFHVIWIPLKEKVDLFNTFNFARFHFLRPLVIYVGFAMACHYLWRAGWQKAVKIIIIAQLVVLLPFNEEIHYRLIHHTPSLKEFYAVELFKDIDEFIGLPKENYRVVSIGLHPAIAQYNGFFTLDTYNNFYPLSYKYEFRKIIAQELAKNKMLKTYYDEWGSRCYIFVDELGKKYDFKKTSTKEINHLTINTWQLYKMGGRFVFSAVPINNAKENHLSLLKSFVHPDSAWKVYVYEVTLPTE